MRIEDLDLSVSSYNRMKRAGYNTVEELCEHTESEILNLRGVGITCLKEIRHKLLSVGLAFRSEE